MRFKFKFKFLLLAGYFVFAILVTLFGVYINDKLVEVLDEVKKASRISQAALNFNVENFHTQLEAWEYAFEPTETRLLAFQKHDEKLIELLDNLVESVEEETRWEKKNPGKLSGLHEGGAEEIKEITSNLEKVRKDWIDLFENLEEVKDLLNAGYDNKDSENHNLYMVALAESKEPVIANADLFDELQFNKKVDSFVHDQEVLVEELYKEQKSTTNSFLTLLTSLVTVFVIIGLGFFVFISRDIIKSESFRKRAK